MTPEVAKFQAMSLVDRMQFLMRLKAAIAASDWDDDLKEMAFGLTGHLSTLTQDIFTFVDEQKAEVAALPQANSGKRLMMKDVNDYPFVSAALRESIMNRLSKGLVNKPPEPEKKKPAKAVELAGKPYEFDEELAP